MKDVYVEFKSNKIGILNITANVTGLGLKNICSNVPHNMGNTWEKIGFIRSVK